MPSDGMNDARRDSEAITKVEVAANELRTALTETGDPLFWKVNPAAVRYANGVLQGSGYRLVKEGVD